MATTTLTPSQPSRRRTGRTTLGSDKPADFARSVPVDDAWDEALGAVQETDPIRDVLHDGGIGPDAELDELIAEQAADAAADGIEFGKTTDTSDERPVTGLYEVPTWKVSATGDTENFAEAPKLTELAHRLIDTVDEFRHLRGKKLLIVWKAKGGSRRGEPKIASADIPGGLTRFFAQTHCVIWFAADHCSKHKLTNEQYEAAMYHELSRCWRTVNDDGTEKPTLRDGITVFPGELKRYGIWRADLARVKDAMAQQTLWEAENQMAEGVL